MMTSEQIRKIIEEKIAGTEKFIVDVSVGTGNRIVAEIDNPQGIILSDCAEISRFIESKLNRDAEDFELTVSSPGLEQPFKILKQYQKNIGRKVRVIKSGGIVTEGELTKANETEIEISQTVIEKLNGKKQIIIKTIPIAFEQITETKIMYKI